MGLVLIVYKLKFTEIQNKMVNECYGLKLDHLLKGRSYIWVTFPQNFTNKIENMSWNYTKLMQIKICGNKNKKGQQNENINKNGKGILEFEPKFPSKGKNSTWAHSYKNIS